MRRRALALALLLACAAATAAAPEPAAPESAASPRPAMLIADRVAIDRDRRLVAEGNVMVIHEGRRLQAQRIVYDPRTEALTIDGPILLTDGAGTIVTGAQAVIAADLGDGILKSARLVLNRQLQIAAEEVARVSGRYTRLSRAVASSCRICALSETPIWEIRARRVVHDELARQIHFDSAQLRVAGLPVLWLPRLRIPDPTVTRATGALVPRLFSTTAIGAAAQLPYFIQLGPHRDLTLIPILATGGAASFGLRYREAFRSGRLSFEGALTADRLRPHLRGFAVLSGEFALPRDVTLSFLLEGVSDRTYLFDYAISERDRLESRIDLVQVRRDRLAAARVSVHSSLRPEDDNAILPSLATDAVLRRRLDVPVVGGRLDLRGDLHTHLRSSTADAIGRDMIRAGLAADWRRDWRLPHGLLLGAEARIAADFYRIMQDAAFAEPAALLSPGAAVTLRWPLLRAGAGGGRQLLEPIVQLAWSAAPQFGRVPNEDSILVAFDEGNLFAPSRFPGADRREGGARLNLGVQWQAFTAAGWAYGGLAGRVIRLDGPAGFTAASGLGGDASDWLLAGYVQGPGGLALAGRALAGDAAGLRRGELRLAVERPRFGLSSGWIWTVADAAENRPAAVAEGAFDARLRIAAGWTARAAGRYDFAADRATAAAIGFEFRNECLRLDITLTRRFTTASIVGESTSLGIGVEFLGLGAAAAEDGAVRVCRR
jgi:LPS-assembly protein